MSLEDYEVFLKTAVKFDGRENVDDLIDVPEEAIQFFLSNNHSRVHSDWLKHHLEKSRHWRNIKNVKLDDVYFDMFDFSDPKEIDRFNFNCFDIQEADLEAARQMFLENVKARSGFYINLSEKVASL